MSIPGSVRRRLVFSAEGGGSRGIALITVLWVLALLVALAAGVAANSRLETRLARNSLDSAQARLAAEAAIQLAILQLISDGGKEADYGDGVVQTGEAVGVTVQLAVFNEAGRIDLNAAKRDLLDGLLNATGVEPLLRDRLVDAILDWRDGDDLRRLNGAEDEDYEAAGSSYGARDGEFESVEELRLVLGMTREIYERVAPAITVHSGKPTVDLNVASPLVRGAVTGVSDSVSRDASPTAARPEDSVRRRAAARPTGTYAIYAQGGSAEGAKASVVATVRLGPSQGGMPFTVLDWRIEPVAAEQLFGASTSEPEEY